MGRGRSPIARSRLPWWRRIRHDRGAQRYWLVAATLALLAAAVIHRSIGDANAERGRWGQTRIVLVAARPIGIGDRLAGAVEQAEWPITLAPPSAVGTVASDARAAAAISPGMPVVADAVVGQGRAGSAPSGSSSGRASSERRTVAVPTGDARLPVRRGEAVDVWASVDPSLDLSGGAPTRRVATGARVVSTGARATVVAVRPSEVAAVAEALSTATVTLVGTG